MRTRLLINFFLIFVVGFFLAWKFFIGLKINYPNFIAVIIDVFERLETILAIIVEPAIKWCIDFLNKIFQWHIELHPHWKHAFSLMTLKLVGDWIIDVGRHGSERRAFMAFELFIGIVIAIVASAIAGQYSLHGQGSDFAIPVIMGVVIYELAKACWMVFGGGYPGKTTIQNIKRYFIRAVGGTIGCGYLALKLGQLYADTYGTTSQSTITLAAFVVFIAILQLVSGAITHAAENYGADGKKTALWTEYLENGQTQIGFRMFKSLGGATAVVLIAIFWPAFT